MRFYVMLAAALLSSFVTPVFAGGGGFTEHLVSDRSSALLLDKDGFLRDNARINLRGSSEPGDLMSPLCSDGNEATLSFTRGSWTVQEVTLPCENWKKSGRGFRYKARKGGPGGVGRIKIRKDRQGRVTLNIRAGGEGHVSAANVAMTSIQVSLNIGGHKLCGRFDNATKRKELGAKMTLVQFRGSTRCQEAPEIVVRRADIPLSTQIVAGTQKVLLHAIEVTNIKSEEFVVDHTNLQLFGLLTAYNLSMSVDGEVVRTIDYPEGYNLFNPWPGITIAGGQTRLFEFHADTPHASGSSLQASTPRYGVSGCNGDYWCYSAPRNDQINGTFMHIVPNGLLFTEFLGGNGYFTLKVTSHLESFQLRRVSLAGVGCEGTQIAVLRPGEQPELVPYIEPLELWMPFKDIAVPGEVNVAAEFATQPGCHLGLWEAIGVGSDSAKPLRAQGCGGDGVCPDTIDVTRVCTNDGCYDCPSWGTREASSDWCIPIS